MNAPEFNFLPEALLVDVPEIDAEQEAIFNLLACLRNCCLADAKGLSLAESMLDRLREHFATAERLAGETLQDLSAPARKHEELIQVAAKLLEASRAGEGNAVLLLRHVEYWGDRPMAEAGKLLDACLADLESREAARGQV